MKKIAVRIGLVVIVIFLLWKCTCQKNEKLENTTWIGDEGILCFSEKTLEIQHLITQEAMYKGKYTYYKNNKMHLNFDKTVDLFGDKKRCTVFCELQENNQMVITYEDAKYEFTKYDMEDEENDEDAENAIIDLSETQEFWKEWLFDNAENVIEAKEENVKLIYLQMEVETEPENVIKYDTIWYLEEKDCYYLIIKTQQELSVCSWLPKSDIEDIVESRQIEFETINEQQGISYSQIEKFMEKISNNYKGKTGNIIIQGPVSIKEAQNKEAEFVGLEENAADETLSEVGFCVKYKEK